MSLCLTSVGSATQYKQIRSLIQAEAQTYRISPLISNSIPTFLVQQANGEVHKAAKCWLESTLTMIVVRT